MSKIRVLPDQLANQIAAGEVVERPASVAKELVENALDAAATRIVVDVEAGGQRLLRVTDDGEGMSRDDAVLAFERHATSKIARAEDLMAIRTLGFRGEALASIASVARVELTSGREAETATRVIIEGGRLRDVKDAAHPRGTTILVRDLFFNVPARRKFLRSEATESFHLTNLVTHYALAHPEIAFTLTNNGRETMRTAPASDLRERAYQVFGGGFLENLLDVHGGQQHVAVVRGFISAPRERRTSRDAQYLFINGRYVRDRLIGRALSEGYRTILPNGVFPVALLFLEVPLEEVDVNVHPAKTEVRFRRAAAVADAVRETVRATLASAGYLRDRDQKGSSHISTLEPEWGHDEALRESYSDKTEGTDSYSLSPHDGAKDSSKDASERVKEPAQDLGQIHDAGPSSATISPKGNREQSRNVLRAKADQTAINFASSSGADAGQLRGFGVGSGGNELRTSLGIEAVEHPISPALPANRDSGLSKTGNSTHFQSVVGPSVEAASVEPQFPLPRVDSAANLVREVPLRSVSPNIYPLGQLAESYIVAADAEGLLLIDQHAAHERILFDKFRALEQQRKPESQNLLVPETFDLTPAQATAFATMADDLEHSGFALMRLSGRTVAIKAVPAGLPAGEARNILSEILDTVEAGKRNAVRASFRDQIATSLACHAAIKINTALPIEKLRWLIDEVLRTSSPSTCPHGRPLFLRLATQDIQKVFHRT